jgi:uncharacterized repeat protein (TIGR02543 family)
MAVGDGVKLAERDGYTFEGWALSSTASKADVITTDNIDVQADTPTSLYAVWSRNYSLTFVSGTDPSQLVSGTAAVSADSCALNLVTAPARDGYTFLGWSRTQSATSIILEKGDIAYEDSNFYVMKDGEKTSVTSVDLAKGESDAGTVTDTLYAVYALKEFSLTYNLNAPTQGAAVDARGVPSSVSGDANDSSFSVVDGADQYVFTLTDAKPECAGYEFVGWSTEPGGSVIQGDTYAASTSSTVLYAVWAPKSYTLAFDSGVQPITKTSTTGLCSFTDLPVPEPRAGYKFAGWSLDGNQLDYGYDNGSWWHWSYCDNNNDPLDIPVASKFESITLTEEDRSNSGVSQTLHAMWVPVIELKTGTEEESELLEGATGADGLRNFSLDKAPVPTRAGYRFMGWSWEEEPDDGYIDFVYVLDEDGTVIWMHDDEALFESSFSLGNLPSAEQTAPTLYAVWAKEYSITFDPDNGEEATVVKATSTGGSYGYYGELPVPTREGYQFCGWSLTKDAWGIDVEKDGDVLYDPSDGSFLIYSEKNGYVPYSSYHPIQLTESSSSLKLYAVWAPITHYTLTFDANLSSVDVAEDAQVTNMPEDESEDSYAQGGIGWHGVSIFDKPELDGYTFLGWSTKAGATSREDCVSYIDLTPESPSLTLYAVWAKEYTYEVSYNDDGLFEVPEDAPFSVVSTDDGYELTISAFTPARYGYRFLGWDASGNGEADYESGETVALTGDNATLTLSAVWDQYLFAMYLMDADGSLIVDDETGEPLMQEVEKGTTIVAPEAPAAPEGKVFAGWELVSNEPVLLASFEGDELGGDGLIAEVGELDGLADVPAAQSEEPAAELIQPGDEIAVTGDIYLRAVWEDEAAEEPAVDPAEPAAPDGETEQPAAGEQPGETAEQPAASEQPGEAAEQPATSEQPAAGGATAAKTEQKAAAPQLVQTADAADPAVGLTLGGLGAALVAAAAALLRRLRGRTDA